MIRDYKTCKFEEFATDLSEELNKVAFSLDPLSSADDFTIFHQTLPPINVDNDGFACISTF